MHETVLKTLTVGIVAGLAVYWLTSRKDHAEYGGKNANPGAYKPTLGDVRIVRFGNPTCADCQCYGLVAPETTTTPLAADYLCDTPDYAPATSGWNLGVSLQVTCRGLDIDAEVHRSEINSSYPIGVSSPRRTTPLPLRLTQRISCSPDVPLCVPDTGVI